MPSALSPPVRATRIRGSARGKPCLRANSEASLFTARLTIDVTPEQRGRIKVTAFRRGQTVADMLRELLAREFPDKDGDPQ